MPGSIPIHGPATQVSRCVAQTVRLARKGETEDGWEPGSLDFAPVTSSDGYLLLEEATDGDTVLSLAPGARGPGAAMALRGTLG